MITKSKTIISLQKKIVRRLIFTNIVQSLQQRHWYSLSIFIANFEQCPAMLCAFKNIWYIQGFDHIKI